MPLRHLNQFWLIVYYGSFLGTWVKTFWIYPPVIISRPPHNNWWPPVIIWWPLVINWGSPYNNWWPRVINWWPPYNNWWPPVIMWWPRDNNWRIESEFFHLCPQGATVVYWAPGNTFRSDLNPNTWLNLKMSPAKLRLFYLGFYVLTTVYDIHTCPQGK